MASVTEEEWQSFRSLEQGINYDQIFQASQYNEFYGIQFSEL